jgi:site-specific recombinase XerD
MTTALTARLSSPKSTTTPGAILAPSPFDAIANLVLDTVSERTKRDYGRALRDYMRWHVATGQDGLTKASVQAHITHLKASGVTDSSINQRLAAIRKLANEAADNDLISESAAQAIGRVANIKRQGRKLGNWLNAAQASAMLNAPNAGTLKGKRDRAILAVMLGAGLRREEVVSLTVAHLQQRDARWVILDLVGKHNRVRTVPIASWVKVAIDKWTVAAAITAGPLFRPVLKGGRLQDGAMTAQAVWDVVQQYAPMPGLAPHDLRRTFAKLADKGGSPLAQIQRTLGHASIQTTERYIGYELDLVKAPSDCIKLEIED